MSYPPSLSQKGEVPLVAVAPYQQEGGVVEQLKQSSSLPLHMRYMSGEFMMTLVVSNQWNGQWTGRRNGL